MPRVVVIGACLIAAACHRPSEGREQRDFERMRQQQRYDAYESSNFFRDGAVMQAPPAHTIARAAGDPWSDTVGSPAFLTGMIDSADVPDLPIAVDQATLERGRKQFAISCVPCHGEGGYGGGVMAPNLQYKRPPSLRTPPVSSLPAGTIFKVITGGLGTMPPYGWQIPVETRWAVIAYVRALSAQPSTVATRADSTAAAYLHALDSTHVLAKRLMMMPPDTQPRAR